MLDEGGWRLEEVGGKEEELVCPGVEITGSCTVVEDEIEGTSSDLPSDDKVSLNLSLKKLFWNKRMNNTPMKMDESAMLKTGLKNKK